MARKRSPYIEVKRELVGIDTHEGCGGIVFNFLIEQLDLSTFVGSREIRKIRNQNKQIDKHIIIELPKHYR